MTMTDPNQALAAARAAAPGAGDGHGLLEALRRAALGLGDPGDDVAYGDRPQLVAEIRAARATLHWRAVSCLIRALTQAQQDGTTQAQQDGTTQAQQDGTTQAQQDGTTQAQQDGTVPGDTVDAEARLEAVLEEYDGAEAADRSLAQWIASSGVVVPPDAETRLDAARRAARRDIAELTEFTEQTEFTEFTEPIGVPEQAEFTEFTEPIGVPELRPAGGLLSAPGHTELMTRFREARAGHLAAAGEDDGVLAQAAMGAAVHALATRTWDDEAEDLLTALTARVRATRGHRGRLPEVLLPVGHVNLSLAKVLVTRLLPGRDESVEVSELGDLLARGEEVIGRIEGPDAPWDPLVAPLAGVLHMLVGALLLMGWDDDAGRLGDDVMARAEAHFARAPDELRPAVEEFRQAARLRRGLGGNGREGDGVEGDGGDGGDGPADDDARAEAEEAARRLRAVNPHLFEELGVGIGEVLSLARVAQTTRQLADIDRALERSGVVQAGLPSGHPMLGQLLTVTAHLRSLRGSLTLDPADAVAAVRAGTQALENAPDDGEPPDFGTVHPLTEALLVTVSADARGIPHDRAETAYARLVRRPDLDERTRLSAALGLGMARGLRWAAAQDEGLRHAARGALGDALELLRTSQPNLETLRCGLALLQFELAMGALWRDPDAPAAMEPVANHLEAVLQQHPDLRGLLDRQVGTLNLAAAGIPGLDGRDGVLGVVRTMRDLSRMLGTFYGMTSTGPLAGMLGNLLSGANTAGPLLDAARRDLRSGQGFSLPDLTTAMPALLAALRGDTDPREHIARAMGCPDGQAPPAATAADDAVRRALDGLRTVLGEPADGGSARRRPLTAGADRLDPDALHAATDALALASTDGVDADLRHAAGDLLGAGLAELYWTGAAGLDTLTEAVRLLEEARQGEIRPAPSPRMVDRWDLQSCCYHELWRCRRRDTGLDDALSATRAGLRELGRLVLVARDTTAAMNLADRADRLVTRAVAWCLDADRGTEAVGIAEAGRGLVLAAATLTGRVEDMLRALGEPEAADGWAGRTDEGLARGLAAKRPGTRPTGGFERTDEGLARGLAVLSREPVGLALLGSSSAQDVVMALHATERLESVVYLVPPGRVDPLPPGAPARVVATGHALVVRPGFAVDVVPLPELTQPRLPEVTRYLDALESAVGVLRARTDLTAQCGFRGTPGGGAWVTALRELGAWAYRTVVRPLLVHLGVPVTGPPPARPRHVALVPLGLLGAVPFAAAWTADPLRPGRPRYAVDDLVLSQAASGRLLAEAARRRPLPVDRRPVFLVNAGKEFVRGQATAEAIAEHLYPSAELYGPITPDGPADADTILSVLPRRQPPGSGTGATDDPRRGPASVLHFITHAVSPPKGSEEGSDVLTGARLQLRPAGEGDEGSWLCLREVLDQAQGRDPEAPTGLVVCDACVTDVTVGRRDESLSLVTAFLAAGASGAIGTRWPVDDDTAGVFAYVLHHHLRQGTPPAQALRATQLWMLDRDREPVPGLPDQLAKELTPGRWTEAASWAAYVHHGA
jgi:hypothetical protein